MADSKEFKKEYWQQLFQQPLFWFGAILFLIGALLRYLDKIEFLTFIIMFVIGLIFMISTKSKIIKELEQKYPKK